jgi:hypothetical protein
VRRIAQNVESKMRNFPGHKSGRAVTLSRLLVRWDEQSDPNLHQNQELAGRQMEQLELKISAAHNPNTYPNIP